MHNTVTHDVVEPCASTGEGGPFVLNLCSVPGPIAVPQPRGRDLGRYAFFVSRGREGESDRFWLHMGYFQSRDEAQKWLGVLNRIYPMAFVAPAHRTFASVT
jgi:hypothetical protein